jgi:hypothetical protein
MATSGTTNFNLSIDELVEEAFERCGMEMTTGHHLKTARRSLNLMFLDWANRGLNLWTIEEVTYNLSQGVTSITLPTDTVQVLTAVIRDSSQSPPVDITIDPITRAEYLDIPDKATQARPAQYYVERTNIPKVYFYPTPNLNATYQFRYYRIRRIQDAGGYTNTLDVNYRFLPCLAAGLAYYLSLKFAADRTPALKQIYEEEWARAAAEDRETARISFVPELGV